MRQQDPAQSDRCPRCGGGFQCGFSGSAPCACTTLKLDDAALAALRAHYTGCLCLRCLGEIAAGAPVDARPTRQAG